MKFLVFLFLVSYAYGLPRPSFDNENLLKPNVPVDSMTRPIYGGRPESRPIYGEKPELPSINELIRPSPIPQNPELPNINELIRPSPIPPPTHEIQHDASSLVQVIVNFLRKESSPVPQPEINVPLPEYPMIPEYPEVGPFPLPEYPQNPDHGTFPLLPFPSPQQPEHPIAILPEEVPVGTFPGLPGGLTRPNHEIQESLVKPANKLPLIY